MLSQLKPGLNSWPGNQDPTGCGGEKKKKKQESWGDRGGWPPASQPLSRAALAEGARSGCCDVHWGGLCHHWVQPRRPPRQGHAVPCTHLAQRLLGAPAVSDGRAQAPDAPWVGALPPGGQLPCGGRGRVGALGRAWAAPSAHSPQLLGVLPGRHPQVHVRHSVRSWQRLRAARRGLLGLRVLAAAVTAAPTAGAPARPTRGPPPGLPLPLLWREGSSEGEPGAGLQQGCPQGARGGGWTCWAGPTPAP